MKPLAQNTLIQGRYLVVHLIGKGGMGEVYLAIDQRLGHPVALKRTVFADDDAMGSAFEREARTLARLRHSALPKVSDHFSDGGNQFLVMEHIAGDDLGKRLAGINKPFPLSWVLFWADQLLEALNYLHSNEPPIIHRDIKPQNLKLTEDNSIILLDFGLSKSGVNQMADPVSGSSGSIIGYTPHFAPMEQIRGTGTNPRSDIYSLAATLYQLLTNICPADALTRADAMLGGSPDPLQPIHEVNPEVPKGISDVIIKGMSVSQDQRFASAREMQKFLRDAYSKIQGDMGAQTVIMDSASVQQAPAAEVFDAPTLPDSVETLTKQSDLKTEVFVVSDVPPAPVEAAPEAPEAVSQSQESFSADATMPAINLQAASIPADVPRDVPTPPASPFSVMEPADSAEPEPTPFAASAEPVAAVSGAGTTAPVQQAAQGKSSKGMLIGILAGIVVLGVFLVGGLIGAYYLMGSSSSSADESNVAEPTPESLPSPTPEPTVESTPEETNTNTASPSPSPEMSSPTPTPTPASTATPRPTPGTVTRPTQKPTPRPQPQPQPTSSRPPRQIPQ